MRLEITFEGGDDELLNAAKAVAMELSSRKERFMPATIGKARPAFEEPETGTCADARDKLTEFLEFLSKERALARLRVGDRPVEPFMRALGNTQSEVTELRKYYY